MPMRRGRPMSRAASVLSLGAETRLDCPKSVSKSVDDVYRSDGETATSEKRIVWNNVPMTWTSGHLFGAMNATGTGNGVGRSLSSIVDPS